MMMLPNAIFRCLFLIGLTAIGFGGSLAFAQPPGEESVTHIARKLPGSVLREGGLPHDSRLGPLRGEKGDFPLIPTFSSKEWAAQKQRVRQIMFHVGQFGALADAQRNPAPAGDS